MSDLAGLIVAAGIPTTLVVYWLAYPEKAEIAAGQMWRLFNLLPKVFKTAHKRYLKHDLQGRLRDFNRDLFRQAPYLSEARPKVEWVDAATDREAFLSGEKVVLRLRRDDPEDRNFVHGSYLYVSHHLLAPTKRYISPSHRESIDLYVTGKLLEKERSNVVGYYLDEFVHPRTEKPDAKIGDYIDAFEQMDDAGLFFGVFLYELHFLGLKVFGRRKNDQIIIEVNKLIDFLEAFATRSVGDDTVPSGMSAEYCRCEIVILGKSHNITPGGETWVNYINTKLAPKPGADTIYLVALAENRDVVDAVAEQVAETYDVNTSRERTVTLRYGEDRVSRKQYLVVLRRKGTGIFQASA